MADEAVVLDPGVDDGQGASGVDDGQGASGADDGAAGGGDGDDGARGAEGGEGGKGADAAALTGLVVKDAGGQLKMTPALKSRLDEMKAKGGEDARLAKMIRASVMEAETVRERGGAKALLEQVAKLEELGGEEGIASTKEELGQWRQLDEDFKAGKPEVAKDIAAGNPEAFCKIAPHLFSEYAQMDPDGFSGYVGRLTLGDMQAKGVPMAMQLMMRDLFEGGAPKLDGQGNVTNAKAGLEQVAGEWVKVAAWVDRITGLAELQSKGPKKPEGGKEGGSKDGEPDPIEQRERAQTEREWGFEKSNMLNSATEKAWKEVVGNRAVTPGQVKAINKLFDSYLSELFDADKGHKKTVDSFFNAKQKSGYLKHMKAAYDVRVPKAMKLAVADILPGKPGPKAAADKGKGADAGKGAAAAAPPAGVERKMGKPPMKDVAWKNSVKWYARTAEMKAKGMYPLKNGKIEQYVG